MWLVIAGGNPAARNAQEALAVVAASDIDDRLVIDRAKLVAHRNLATPGNLQLAIAAVTAKTQERGKTAVAIAEITELV